MWGINQPSMFLWVFSGEFTLTLPIVHLRCSGEEWRVENKFVNIGSLY